MKKLYFGSNLKMYKGIKETREYLQKLSEFTKDISREELELFIFPSYTSLPDAAACIDPNFVTLGAQNICWEDKGQFTGEISLCMLEELSLNLVMVGHSERRHIYGENNIQENKKVTAALNHGFKVLLCIGETADEKKYGIAAEVLKTQIKVGLHNVDASRINNLRVAYEPVWSIGTNGVPAGARYAETMHKVIRQTLAELFGERGKEIPALYGGSVNLNNAKELIIQPSIDGLFVGRSAWEAEKFNHLIRSAQKAQISNFSIGG